MRITFKQFKKNPVHSEGIADIVFSMPFNRKIMVNYLWEILELSPRMDPLMLKFHIALLSRIQIVSHSLFLDRN